MRKLYHQGGQLQSSKQEREGLLLHEGLLPRQAKLKD